jgi:hypothetical protein
MPPFPCLGISSLGLCWYNPALPSPVYFTFGNAIAALGITLAIQQFIKPVYLFRVRAYGLRLSYFILPVFLGFLCTMVAMIMPNLPLSHTYTLEYPIVWEFLGGIFIGIPYALIAFISIRPARLHHFNVFSFVRAAMLLLSEADDADRAAFARDLLRNIDRLLRYAVEWNLAEQHSSRIEFERLREQGAPTQLTGPLPMSPFYAFSHRTELERARHAGTLLRVLSDPPFCSALVRKCAWLTAGILGRISSSQLHTDFAEPFVQELVRQALVNDESMIAKEVRYEGFATTPVLSEALFQDWFILWQYNPMAGMFFSGTPDQPTAGYVSRLNGASRMMLEATLQHGGFWMQQHMYGVESAYKNLFFELSAARSRGAGTDFLVQLHIGIADLYKILRADLQKLEPPRRRGLYTQGKGEYQHDLVHIIASIVYESLQAIANRFAGLDDPGWHHAIGVFQDIYPSFGEIPPGMDALQQQLAVMLIDKLRQNMRGLYPAISRVLLSVMEPYDSRPELTTPTAHVLLKRAMFKELTKLPSLCVQEPERVDGYFPLDVTYDKEANTLTYIYRRGAPHTTRLSEIEVPEVNLFDVANWQITPLPPA